MRALWEGGSFIVVFCGAGLSLGFPGEETSVRRAIGWLGFEHGGMIAPHQARRPEDGGEAVAIDDTAAQVEESASVGVPVASKAAQQKGGAQKNAAGATGGEGTAARPERGGGHAPAVHGAGLPELCQMEARQAEKDAHFGHMRQELVQAWGVLQHEARMEVHASHRAEMAAVVETKQGLVAFVHPAQATFHTSLREREEAMRFDQEVAEHKARVAERRAEARTASDVREFQEELQAIRRWWGSLDGSCRDGVQGCCEFAC